MVEAFRLHTWSKFVAVSTSSSFNYIYGEIKMENPNDTIAGLTKQELYDIIYTAVVSALTEAYRLSSTQRADSVAQMLKDRVQILKG